MAVFRPSPEPPSCYDGPIDQKPWRTVPIKAPKMTVISKVLPAVELAGVGLVFIGSTSVVANDNLGRLHTFGIHLGAEDFFANRSN